MNKNKRRKFIKDTLLASVASMFGMPVVFAKSFPEDMIPAALLDSKFTTGLPGKSDKMTILNDRPINAETAAHYLDSDLTPNELFFVRNNGIPPTKINICLLYTSPSPRDKRQSRMPSSA